MLVTLPDGNGLVEVVKKEGASGSDSMTSEVAFYFFKSPFKPYSPAPTSGTLEVGQNKKIVKVALKAEGEALVTPPGPALFRGGDVDGSLSVELDGKPTTIPLGMR
jgi:hypothetical protein